LAILLHKPLDAVSITSLMVAGGWSSGWRHAVNFGFSLMCPLGAAIVWLGVERFGDSREVLLGCVLAFSAGVFLCISLGDLLPEIEFHAHDRVGLSVAVLAGLLLAYGMRFFEPEHFHAPPVHSAGRAPDEDDQHWSERVGQVGKRIGSA
jgi:zinc and cadmium transporter